MVRPRLVEAMPGRALLPPEYRDLAQRVLDLAVRPDDVWVISYPRTGSTIVQEMVWCIGNNLDFEAAKLFKQLRCPLLEFTAITANYPGPWKDNFKDSVEYVEYMASPRFIKTHLPADLLPRQLFTVKPKIIYESRNPKDVFVSCYHYYRLFYNYTETLEEFGEVFLQGNVPFGLYWNHVLDFWKLRHDDNVLFLKYEDIIKDAREVMLRVGKYLRQELTEEGVDQLMDHCSFARMRENPALDMLHHIWPQGARRNKDSSFVRKGKVGDWKERMSPQLSARFDETNARILGGSGLTFDSEAN